MFEAVKYIAEAMSPINDVYNFSTIDGSDDLQKIIIECKNKRRRVTAVLSDDINLNIHAQWEGFLSNVQNSKLGGLVDFFEGMSAMSGRTLQQPWMSRMNYKKTDPLKFTIPLRFVTGAGDSNNLGMFAKVSTAKEDVWEPILALASFCYPRLLTGDDQGSSYLINAEDLHPPTGKKWDENTLAIKKGVVGLSSGLLSFAIPGQNPFYADNSSNKFTGDPVSIQLGRFGTFESVYITDINGKISSVLDDAGYPVSAELNVTFQVQDSTVVGPNGNFSFQDPGYGAEATASISSAIGKLSEFAEWGTREVNTSWVQSVINMAGSDSGSGLINLVKSTIAIF